MFELGSRVRSVILTKTGLVSGSVGSTLSELCGCLEVLLLPGTLLWENILGLWRLSSEETERLNPGLRFLVPEDELFLDDLDVCLDGGFGCVPVGSLEKSFASS